MATYYHTEVPGSPTSPWRFVGLALISTSPALVVFANPDGTETRLISYSANFIFDPVGNVLGGTANELARTDAFGATTYEILTGLSIPASAFYPNSVFGADEYVVAERYYGWSGQDVLIGGPGESILYGAAGNDQLDGGEGDDVLEGGAGDDVLAGGIDSDGLYGGAGNDQADGGPHDDVIDGWEGDDILSGGTDDDILTGGPGDDEVYGGLGEDLLWGGLGGDALIGGGGNDNLSGDEGNDELDGSAGRDEMRGGTGDDIYILRAAEGGAVADPDLISESAGEGTDTIRFVGVSPAEVHFTVSSAYGPNYLRLAFPGGDVTFTYTDIAASVSADGSDIGQRIEKVVFDDGTVWDLTKGITLTGSDDDAETLNGTPSADTLTGLAESDSLYGHKGDDFAYGGLGPDYLYGGTGNDQLEGGPGDDAFYGGAGQDDIWGRSGSDTLSGDEDNDFIDAGSGNDIIYGGDGNDKILARPGDDQAYGGDGNDYLTGSTGMDILTGGAGADHFQITNKDLIWDDAIIPKQWITETITDFNAAEGDVLNVDKPSQWIFSTDGSNGWLTNATLPSEAQILLQGVTTFDLDSLF